MTLTIKQIREQLFGSESVHPQFLKTLQNDSRKGVQQLLRQYERRLQQEKQLQKEHASLQRYENKLYEKGYTSICGVDEAGRGPLAGPVVAAAVILQSTDHLVGLTDSKQLSKQQRIQFAKKIKEEALAYSIHMVHAADIDQMNIYEATKKAMACAVNGLSTTPDYILVDAMKLQTNIPQLSLIKGDAKSLSIAASSVLAKVARDEYMEKVAEKFPNYGFEKHVGYGTKAHIHALQKHGPTSEHRCSFQIVKQLLNK